MAKNNNSTDGLNDAFSNLPDVKSTGNDSQKNTSPDAAKNKLDNKSTSYTVKKITSSFSNSKTHLHGDTGLNTVSIDTDSFTDSPDKSADSQILSQTTIETGEFQNISQSKENYPIIIDETDSYTKQENAEEQTPVTAKKDKNIVQQNISIDIPSEYYYTRMPSEKNNDQLGTGKVVCSLGSGGMAKVYKIWNEKLEIFRAVKVLTPTNQKENWNRFLTEAKITVKLHHPNIIETYDTGDWHGLPIIEMELIEGDTLNTVIGIHPMIPSPVCASIALQISKALEYAHSQQIQIYGKMYNGIIHRDLKPSNIMITPKGIVKLMDFGVARPIETGLHTIATDSIVGTIHYFSPEQIGGYPIDQLSDVYSFGAVLYEILCGSNPFPHTNMVNMIQAKTKNQFKRLEDYHLKIDNRLASVAQTCMRTEKRQRFSNFSEIRKVLDEIIESYNMGTPEEIITAFYQNPSQIQYTFEQQLLINQQQSVILNDNAETATQGNVSYDLNDKPDKNEAESEIPQTWDSRTPFRKSAILLVALLVLIVSIAAFVFTKEKEDKPQSANKSTQSVTAPDKVDNKVIENKKSLKISGTTPKKSAHAKTKMTGK